MVKFQGTVLIDDAELRGLIIELLSHRYGVSAAGIRFEPYGPDGKMLQAVCELTSIKTRA